jgi:hypothetical protein
MIAIFEDAFLKEHTAMRDGTALHKIHLAPPARYSEDIDLVPITDLDEKHLAAGLKRALRPVLGERAGTTAQPPGLIKGSTTRWRSMPRIALSNAIVLCCIPASRQVVIPEATHLMSYQNPSAFNAALLRFLADH